MKFECTNCGQHLEAEEEHRGQTIECPSCAASIQVPSASESSESGVIPPPLPEQAAVVPPQAIDSISPEKEDKEKLAGLRGALLVMPFYMLSLLFVLFALWQGSGVKVSAPLLKVGFGALIIMVGISARSWQCLKWISTDPYRATAMGKKLFLLFIVLSSLDTLIADWPSDKFEGPLSALSTEQVTYGYSDQRQIYVVDPNQTELVEAGFWAWLAFIFDFASQLIEELAIFAFISVLYVKLRGSRQDFSWDHFLHEVSFGKWGTEYKWSEQDAA